MNSFLHSAKEQSIVFPAGKPKAPRFLFQVGQETGGRAGGSVGCPGLCSAVTPSCSPHLCPLCAAPGLPSAAGAGVEGEREAEGSHILQQGWGEGNWGMEQPQHAVGLWNWAHR